MRLSSFSCALSRVASRVLLLGIAIGLSACGTVKLAYDHGETLTMFWVGRYIDLDDAQDQLVRERVHGLFVWHRSTQLPDYIALAESLKSEVFANFSDAEQEAIEQALRERGYRALNRALPDLADIALALHAAQLMKTAEKFADNDREYREHFVEVSDKRRKQDRFDVWRERLEYWYGDLNDQQLSTLHSLSDRQPVDASLWLAERQRREQDGLNLLRHIAQDQPPREDVMIALAALARRLESSPDAATRAYIETMKASNRRIYVTLANMTTPAQRQAAVQKLGEWISDMRAATLPPQASNS